MDHLDRILNDSSPSTFAAEPRVARELRAVTAHVSRRRIGAIFASLTIAAFVLGAGTATASASDPAPFEQVGTADADVLVSDDCVAYLKVADSEPPFDAGSLPGSAVVTLTLADGSETIVVEVLQQELPSSCDQ